MYPGHPYGALVSEASLNALSRDQLVAFHGFYWKPERMSLAIVGDLRLAEAKQLVERVQGLMDAGTSERDQTLAALTNFRSGLGPAPKAPLSGQAIRIEHPASQAHIWMGLPVLARHEVDDYFPLLVANHILGGGGFVSRLTKEIREKRGMAYSVFSAVQPLAQTGPFFLGLQTQRDQAAEALKVVNETLADFISKGPTEEELTAAKKNLIGGFALRLDSNRKLIDNLAAIQFYKLPANYLETWTDRIELVTQEDIQNVLNQRFSGRGMATVIVAGSPSP
jgi:zinc protease